MPRLSKLRQINVAALLVAAAGILLIFASAPDLFPAVPPGPIILTVAAAVVACIAGRWTAVIGVAVPVFIIVGGIVSGGLANNLDENAVVIAGTAIELISLATAIGAEHWQAAVARQEDAIRANHFLRDYLRSEYVIAYQLDRLRALSAAFGTVPIEARNDPNNFPSLAFAAQVLRVLEESTVKQSRAFVKRV